MILLPTQNNKDYYFLLSSEEKLKLYLICPCCNSAVFINWSSYPRTSLPNQQLIIIQRMRCSDCKVTHALLPAFLFGKIRHTNETIAHYVELFVNQETTISKISRHISAPPAPEDVSTLYRWFNRLLNKCKQLLPLLQQEIKKHGAKYKFKSAIKDTNTDANNYQIPHVYSMAQQLVKLSQQCDAQGNLLSPLIFLNYFCWQKTSQPLMVVLKFGPT